MDAQVAAYAAARQSTLQPALDQAIALAAQGALSSIYGRVLGECSSRPAVNAAACARPGICTHGAGCARSGVDGWVLIWVEPLPCWGGGRPAACVPPLLVWRTAAPPTSGLRQLE